MKKMWKLLIYFKKLISAKILKVYIKIDLKNYINLLQKVDLDEKSEKL